MPLPKRAKKPGKRTPQVMTPRMQLFVREYLVDLNPSAAYVRAGFTSKNPTESSRRLMLHPDVLAAIKPAMTARRKRIEVSQDRVIEELAAIAFADTTQAIRIENGAVRVTDTIDLDIFTRRAISEIKQTTGATGGSISVKFHDKKGALESLGRHLGLFPNKVELSGPGGGPIEVKQDLSVLSTEELRVMQDILRKVEKPNAPPV